jgi:hypothetical protein
VSARSLAGTARRALVLAAAASIALGVGACGNKQAHPTVADANNNGFYVDAGPITYQLQVSRELNPSDVEDRGYLAGLPAATLQPAANEEWFAVFLWAKNQTSSPQTTTATDSFDIVDTQGNRYLPVTLNPQLNPYVWTSQTLLPQGIEPAPGSTAYFGPTQGGELLFKINTSAYANRPLTLEIHAPGQTLPSTISLDL